MGTGTGAEGRELDWSCSNFYIILSNAGFSRDADTGVGKEVVIYSVGDGGGAAGPVTSGDLSLAGSDTMSTISSTGSWYRFLRLFYSA